jgi:predicted house-cleaning noncanonical NTP pyrophosphatase (MazG superfamily)
VTEIKKIFYNKLVRDNIPQVIEKSGGVAEFQELSPEKFRKELLLKVGEEASGLVEAKDKTEITKELADILAVIEEIKKVEGITDDDIEKAIEENFAKKGGFDGKLFLVWSEDTGYKTNERRNTKKK